MANLRLDSARRSYLSSRVNSVNRSFQNCRDFLVAFKTPIVSDRLDSFFMRRSTQCYMTLMYIKAVAGGRRPNYAAEWSCQE